MVIMRYKWPTEDDRLFNNNSNNNKVHLYSTIHYPYEQAYGTLEIIITKIIIIIMIGRN